MTGSERLEQDSWYVTMYQLEKQVQKLKADMAFIASEIRRMVCPSCKFGNFDECRGWMACRVFERAGGRNVER